MTLNQSTQQNLQAIKRYALFILFICYLPHITTEPWWLFVMLLTAIGYNFLGEHFSYFPKSGMIVLIFIFGSLLILNKDIHAGEFFIRFLLIFIILKCLELRTTRDIKVLILCNFFLIFSALIVVQELWIISYLLIAIFANLSLMLKMSTSEVTLWQITRQCGQQLLLAIPLSILLFFIFPRINPLWQVPAFTKAATGFSEKMHFGSIAEVFNDDATVMQISFTSHAIVDGYWRGLVLNFYTGESWYPVNYNQLNFLSLRVLRENEPADYEILLEPTQSKWLFYEGYPSAAKPNLKFSRDAGLIRQNNDIVTQRLAYAITVKTPPYALLTTKQYEDTTQLPKNLNPRLKAWAKEQFAKNHNNLADFLNFLHTYIQQQPFWYTLTPPMLNATRNQMDSFWFETQKGFCEHYTSAVTFILRSIGVPARVVLGFQGGSWNPIAHTITIRKYNAHAWLEYWQEGIGWKQLDPTTFISPERIDPTIRTRQIDDLNAKNFFTASQFPWQQRIQFFFESLHFEATRWLLYYNQFSQQSLLNTVGLGKLNHAQLLQFSIGVMIIFFVILGWFYQWRQKQTLDYLLREYHLLQKEFQRFNILISRTATLKQQCQSIINNVPPLKSLLDVFYHRYEQLRLQQTQNDSSETKKATINLFKKLRYQLRDIGVKSQITGLKAGKGQITK